jgi:hypothetical protein
MSNPPSEPSEPDEPVPTDPIPSIGEAGRVVREKFNRLRNSMDIADSVKLAAAGGVVNKHALPQGEHYHACFQMVGSDAVLPFFGVAFPTKRTAYLYLKKLGEDSEPNTEWGQDGRIQIETPVAGRTGLFRVRVSVARCIARKCAGKKRSRILLPDRRN